MTATHGERKPTLLSSALPRPVYIVSLLLGLGDSHSDHRHDKRGYGYPHCRQQYLPHMTVLSCYLNLAPINCGTFHSIFSSLVSVGFMPCDWYIRISSRHICFLRAESVLIPPMRILTIYSCR